MGVLPLPPLVMFPMQMTGTSTFSGVALAMRRALAHA
jgi:hypothetical protein